MMQGRMVIAHCSSSFSNSSLLRMHSKLPTVLSVRVYTYRIQRPPIRSYPVYFRLVYPIQSWSNPWIVTQYSPIEDIRFILIRLAVMMNKLYEKSYEKRLEKRLRLNLKRAIDYTYQHKYRLNINVQSKVDFLQLASPPLRL